MTGRRSIAGWDARLSRALQFVPGHVGGRVASAQPVRRNGGTLRGPSVGAVRGPIVLAGDPENYSSMYPGGSLTYDLTLSAGVGAGDAVVAVFYGKGATLTPPSGWTTLRSGTITNLSYWVGWILLDGSDDLTFTRSSTTYAAVVDAVELRGVASVSASTVTEQASVSTVTLPYPAAAEYARTLQIVAYMWNRSPDGTMGIEFSDGATVGDPLTGYTGTTRRLALKRGGHAMYSPDDQIGNTLGAPLLVDPFWSLHPGNLGIWAYPSGPLVTIDEAASLLVTVS